MNSKTVSIVCQVGFLPVMQSAPLDQGSALCSIECNEDKTDTGILIYRLNPVNVPRSDSLRHSLYKSNLKVNTTSFPLSEARRRPGKALKALGHTSMGVLPFKATFIKPRVDEPMPPGVIGYN